MDYDYRLPAIRLRLDFQPLCLRAVCDTSFLFLNSFLLVIFRIQSVKDYLAKHTFNILAKPFSLSETFA